MQVLSWCILHLFEAFSIFKTNTIQKTGYPKCEQESCTIPLGGLSVLQADLNSDAFSSQLLPEILFSSVQLPG